MNIRSQPEFSRFNFLRLNVLHFNIRFTIDKMYYLYINFINKKGNLLIFFVDRKISFRHSSYQKYIYSSFYFQHTCAGQ